MVFDVYSPIESIEKQMDVYSLCSTADNLFMGCLNHSIIPIKSERPFTASPAITNSHLDTVTSLTSLSKHSILLSVSKDKFLRAWKLPEVNDSEKSQPFTQIKSL